MTLFRSALAASQDVSDDSGRVERVVVEPVFDRSSRRAPGMSYVGIAAPMTAAQARRPAGGGGRRGGGTRKRDREQPWLSESELQEIEQRYGEGITAVQVVDVFVSRHIRFSEATFRKYVQQGLLPRSRRVGRKGKHRGSLGVYPARTVRRINEIKRLMADNYTIEQILQRHLRFTDALEGLSEGVEDLFARFGEAVEDDELDNQTRRAVKRDVREARKAADELLRRLDDVAQRLAAPTSDDYGRNGAAGSAEDLL